MSEKQFMKDPANYRKLSEPFASVEATNAAIVAFGEDLRELRAKHHIRDVICIVSGCYMSSDGTEEIDYAIDIQNGDDGKTEALLAWALGKAQSDRQERISRMMHQSRLEQPKRRK